MKGMLFPVFLLVTCLEGNAQQSGFLSLRYDEDYRFLRSDTSLSFYEQLKFAPLGKSKNSYLSTGGEVRYQGQHFINEDWGDMPVKRYTAFYTRFLLHTDIHAGKYVRGFIQLNSTFANGRVAPARSIDENRFDVQQLFADINFITGKDRQLTLRAGRQELLYGSQRLIAVREGPNNRQSYDAVKLFYKTKKFQADIWYSHPVKVRTGVWDDTFNGEQKLWSVYTVSHHVPLLHNVDVYYIGYWNKQARFNDGAAAETRHSAGTRIWKKTPAWNYDLEALYQFGEFGNKRINAYTASANITYTFRRKKLSPTLGIKTEIISGDRRQNDNRLHTFNPLFPRGAYFGLAALIGPANLIDVHPSLGLQINKQLSLLLDYDVFWRHSRADGIYGPNAALLYPGNNPEKHIGNQLGVSIEYNPVIFLNVVPEFTWFKSGPYLKGVSVGKDVFFAAVTLQLKY